METDGYERLANAIVVQAAKDYRSAIKGKRTKAKTAEVKEIEEFFLSDWFTTLTDVDGRVILKKLQEEVMKNDK